MHRLSDCVFHVDICFKLLQISFGNLIVFVVHFQAGAAKEDAPALTPAKEAAPASPAAEGATDPQSPPQSSSVPTSRGERRVKMSRLRLRIADRLKDAQNTCAFRVASYDSNAFLASTDVCMARMLTIT